MKISIIVVAVVLIAATAFIQVSSEFVSPQSGRTANLIKRSLCNTFGGCGAKRSITPQIYDFKRSDESVEVKRHDTDAKLITEILEDIIEHLKKDQDYRRGKYVMMVPKQNIDGTNYLLPLDSNDGLNVQQPMRNRLEDDFQANRV